LLIEGELKAEHIGTTKRAWNFFSKKIPVKHMSDNLKKIENYLIVIDGKKKKI
jgi:cellobiose phosphorylase